MYMTNRSYDTRRAVRYLACAFGITLAALIASMGIQMYRVHAEREKNAVLLAGDILALRDSRKNADGRVEICLALIDVRSTGLLSEAEQHALRAALAACDPEPLADEIESAFLNRRFSASLLNKSLRRFCASQMPEKDRPDSESDAPKYPFRIAGAVRLAGDFFGISAPFRACRTASGNAAFCRNAYAVFDPRSGKMTEFAMACAPGESVLNADECSLKAAAYLRDRQNMYPTDVLSENSSGGICYVQMKCRGGRTALVGVREDSGGICLFVREWKTALRENISAEPLR